MDNKGLDVSGSVMDGLSEKGLESPVKKPPEDEYQVYFSRWWILGLFSLVSATNSGQWIQYTVIQDAVVEYYGVKSISVYWTSMIFMFVYIPLVFPASWILDKGGLRVAISLGCLGTCLGAWIKVLSAPRHLFWLGFGGQTLVGMSQVFILNVPPRLAAVWFGPDQVSSACAIGVFGNQLGVALGFVLPPTIVRAGSTIDELTSQFRFMFLMIAIITTVLLILIVIFFKAAPPTPPSAAAHTSKEQKVSFGKSVKNLVTNKNYLKLVVSYSINVGIFYAVSTLLNDLVLRYYPTANQDVGRIGLLIVVAGMLGSVCCGLILDKTHRFKEVTLAVYCGTVVVMIIFSATLSCGKIFVVYITAILLGFFMTGYLPVGYEFASEITFPEPEGTTSGILNAVVQLHGIILTLAYEKMLGSIGDLYANMVMVGLLSIGVLITFWIKSDLRRQAAHNKDNRQSIP